jgi:RNA polymerase sigma-70 factor (ECF subfamily)
MKNFKNVVNNGGLDEEKPLLRVDKFSNDNNETNLATLIDHESIIRTALKNNPDKGFEMLFKSYYKPLCNHAVRFVYS